MARDVSSAVGVLRGRAAGAAFGVAVSGGEFGVEGGFDLRTELWRELAAFVGDVAELVDLDDAVLARVNTELGVAHIPMPPWKIQTVRLPPSADQQR